MNRTVFTTTAIASVLLLFTSFALAQNWPQAAGIDGSWRTTGDPMPVSEFSVTTGKNILWKTTLGEGGQSGITVWQDRVFISIMKPYTLENGPKNKRGASIIALCIDAENGQIIWQQELTGSAPSPYMYGFSDSSSPSPVTDGKHVWFTNSSGIVACFDFDGVKVWERRWKLIKEINGKNYPFNKQFEPILFGDTLVNMEPYPNADEKRVQGWNYLVGLDKTTGKQLWVSADALTHYNTPCYSASAIGRPAVLIGAGGHHGTPEGPSGYSMIDLNNGKRIWNYVSRHESGTALYNSTFNEKYALWFTEGDNVVVVLDPHTGEELKTISLSDKVDLRTYDQEKQAYELFSDIALADHSERAKVFPAWFSNILIDDQLYFMCFNSKKKKSGPAYCFCRVNLATDKVEYLEVPVHRGEDGQLIWHKELTTLTLNSRGLNPAQDPRSGRDGWDWVFNGNPICVDNTLFFTMQMGVCYSFDHSAKVFDEHALIALNDLGPIGQTWSMNTPSFANGRLYHRTLKELICIGKK